MKPKLLFVSFLCISGFYLMYLYAQKTGPNKALLDAIGTADHRTIRNLIKVEGADINTTNEQGQTPLMLAAGKGHTSTVEQLLKHKANTDAKDTDGNTALIHAVNPSPKVRITENKRKIVRKLLEHDADPTIKNKDPKDALDLIKEKKIMDDLTQQTQKLLENEIRKRQEAR